MPSKEKVIDICENRLNSLNEHWSRIWNVSIYSGVNLYIIFWGQATTS